MRAKERRDSGRGALFKARLDQIVDMGCPLARLAGTIDWRFLDWRFLEERSGAVYSNKPGQPPLPTRLMARLSILKHTHDLSDEDLCARFLENPYFQLFCGEEFFRHKLPFDRSSLTAPAHGRGEARGADPGEPELGEAHGRRQALGLLEGGGFPTDAKLMHRARELLK